MKRAFVTGGTRGIGLHLCKMLLRNQYEVVFTGRTQENVNNALKLFDSNVNIQGVVMDMTNVSHLPYDLMNFDTVIHNAGMLSRDNITNMNETRLNKMFMVNTMGPIFLTKYYLPYMMKQNSGNIFFFCPPYKIDNKTRKLAPYMQTKLAQTTFMYSLADMMSRSYRGVTVSGFWTDYPIYTDALIHRNIGVKDNCMSPEIIAKTVELMLHDRKENIHGNVIIDRYYLLEKECNPKNWALGNNTKRLDDLFLSNQEKG